MKGTQIHQLNILKWNVSKVLAGPREKRSMVASLSSAVRPCMGWQLLNRQVLLLGWELSCTTSNTALKEERRLFQLHLVPSPGICYGLWEKYHLRHLTETVLLNCTAKLIGTGLHQWWVPCCSAAVVGDWPCCAVFSWFPAAVSSLQAMPLDASRHPSWHQQKVPVSEQRGQEGLAVGENETHHAFQNQYKTLTISLFVWVGVTRGCDHLLSVVHRVYLHDTHCRLLQ